jgi:lipoate-protein ligase B
MPHSPQLPRRVRNLGRVDYLPVWQAMQRFTDERTA